MLRYCQVPFVSVEASIVTSRLDSGLAVFDRIREAHLFRLRKSALRRWIRIEAETNIRMLDSFKLYDNRPRSDCEAYRVAAKALTYESLAVLLAVENVGATLITEMGRIEVSDQDEDDPPQVPSTVSPAPAQRCLSDDISKLYVKMVNVQRLADLYDLPAFPYDGARAVRFRVRLQNIREALVKLQVRLQTIERDGWWRRCWMRMRSAAHRYLPCVFSRRRVPTQEV